MKAAGHSQEQSHDHAEAADPEHQDEQAAEVDPAAFAGTAAHYRARAAADVPPDAYQQEIAPAAAQLGIAAEVRTDADARARVAAAGTPAVVDGNVIYLDPAKVAPGTAAGRTILARQLLSIAEAQGKRVELAALEAALADRRGDAAKDLRLARARDRRGESMPSELAASRSAGYGAPVDDVEMHHDGEAAGVAAERGARAFAIEKDVFFAEGAYQPATPGGQALIAHEVAHTVQQSASTPTVQAKLAVSDHGDASEREADAAAATVLAGGRASLSAAPTQVARLGAEWSVGSAGKYEDQADPTYNDGIFTKDYVALQAPNIIAHTGMALRDLPLPLPDYLRWAKTPADFMVELFSPIWANQGNAWDVLAGVIAPDRIIEVIDTGRDCAPNPKGTKEWRQPVAWELSKSIHRRLLDVFPKLVERWAKVKNQLELRKEEGDATADRAPTLAEVMPGHPLERYIAMALGSQVVLDPVLYRASHPGDRIKQDIRAPRAITYKFLGKHLPTFEDPIEVTSPGDPTREEVALALSGTTETAYQLVQAGRFFNVRDLYPRTPEAKAKREADLGNSPVEYVDDDPELSKQIQLASAGGVAASLTVHPDEGGKMTVLQRISLMIQELDSCQAYIKVTSFDGLSRAKRDLTRRADEIKAGTAAEAVQWDAQTIAQLETIQKAKAGVMGTGAYQGSFTADWDAGKALISRVIDAYDNAFAASAVIEDGRDKLHFADQQHQLMEVELVELLLSEMRRSLNRSMTDKTGLGVETKAENKELAGKEADLRRRAIELRALALTDSPKFQDELKKLREEVSDLNTGVAILANMDQCDAAWKALYDSLSVVGEISGTNDDLSKAMTGANQMNAEWNTIYIAWKFGGEEGKKNAKDAIAELTKKGGRWEQFFTDIRKVISHAATINKWVTFGIMIGIALITAGAGALVEVAGGGVLLVTATEAAVFTTLSYAIVTNPNDMSLGGFVKQLGANFLMFGALRMISMIYTGLIGEAAAATVKGQAGLIVTQFVAMNAYALFEAQMQKLATTGEGLTWGEVGEISLTNFLFVVATTAGGALMRPGLESLKLQGVTSRGLERLTAVKSELRELLGRIESSKGADRDAAMQLVAKQRELVEAEGQALADLEPIAADKKKAARAKLDLDMYARLKAEHGGHVADVERAELMLALEPGGTDTMYVRHDKFAAAVEFYRGQEGNTIVEGATDPITGARIFEVQPKDGTPFKVIEKLGDGAIAEAPRTTVRPTSPEEAAERAKYAQQARDALKAREAAIKAAVDGMTVPEFETIDVGGGISNVMVRASEPHPADAAVPSGPPTRITISDAPERWGTYGDQPIGQTAGELDAPGVDVSKGTTDQHGFVSSKVVGDAIAIGQYEQGVNLYRGKVTTAVEVKGSQADWAAPGKRVRVKVGDRWFYADKINLTTGPGPAMEVADGWFPSTKIKGEMLADNRVVYGDNHLANIRAGAKKVVVSGGSATAAWNAEAAARAGASEVVWAGRPSEPAPGTSEARELAAIREELKQKNLDPERRLELLDRQRDLTSFRKAMLPRNVEPQDSAFQNPAIERVSGKIKSIEPQDNGKVKVTFEDGRVVEDVDQVVVSHGQDPSAPGGLDHLIGATKLKMILTSEGKLVGLESEDGAIRLLGAAFAEPRLAPHVIESQRADFVRLLDEQAAKLAPNSRGVAPSIAMAADTIPEAMDVLGAREFRLKGTSGPLVLAAGQEPTWPHEIAVFFARELGVPVGKVTVTLLGDGKSGDLPYKIQLGDEDVGVFKVFRNNPGDAQTELDIMKAMASKKMEKFDVVDDKGQVVKVDAGGKDAAGVLMETAHGKSVGSMVKNLPEAGPMRQQALAEFHKVTASGSLLDEPAKRSDADYIRGKLQKAIDAGKFGDRGPEIMAAFDATVAKFMKAKVPATAYHGDANIGNFVIDGKRVGVGGDHIGVIDVGNMKWSIDLGSGKGTRTGGADLARFLTSLETLYPHKLTPAEVAHLTQIFESRYATASGVKQEDMEPGVDVYRVETELAAMNKGTLTPAETQARLEAMFGLAAGGGKADPQAAMLTSASKDGDPVATERSIKLGTVAMEQHPDFAATLQKIRDRGFDIDVIPAGNPHIEVTDVVKADGSKTTTHKVVLIDHMRWLDLEEQLANVETLTDKFGADVPAIERKIVDAQGDEVGTPNADGMLTSYQDAVIQYHTLLSEFLKLVERDAGMDLLREHAAGIRTYRQTVEGSRDPAQRSWRDTQFPDLAAMEKKYDEFGGRRLESGP